MQSEIVEFKFSNFKFHWPKRSLLSLSFHVSLFATSSSLYRMFFRPYMQKQLTAVRGTCAHCAECVLVLSAWCTHIIAHDVLVRSLFTRLASGKGVAIHVSVTSHTHCCVVKITKVNSRTLLLFDISMEHIENPKTPCCSICIC